MGDFEYLKEDEEPTGVGADIFVRKRKPGPAVGVGYYIDIYENGVKIQSVDAKTKKDVKQILDEYKGKYNTLRSFEIESQQHVTYKTKEERGETPLKDTEEELKSKETATPERGETAMQAIDQILLKKASTIENLLNRLKDPTLPVRRWAADTAVEQGSVDFLPETPPAGGAEDDADVTEQTVANQMIAKLVEYTQDNAQKPVDELYNGIKHWMSLVKKKLKDWEKMAGKTLDRALIANQIKNVVTSGNVETIKQSSGIDVTPDIATALQKVTLMEIGSAQDKGILAESMGRAASLEEDVAKIIGVVSKAPEAEAKYEAAQALKETFGDSIPDIVQMLPETFHGKAVEKAIKEMEQDAMDKSDSINTTAVNPTSMNPTVEISIKAFWSYASETTKTASIETLFEEWVNKEGISLEEARNVYAAIKENISTIFENRTAIVEADPILKILISNPRGELFSEEHIKVDERSFRSPTGKILISENKSGPEYVSGKAGSISKELDNFFLSNQDLLVPREYTNKNPDTRFIDKAIYTIENAIIGNIKQFPTLYGAIVNALATTKNGVVRISFYEYDGGIKAFSAIWKDSALVISADEAKEEAAAEGTEEAPEPDFE